MEIKDLFKKKFVITSELGPPKGTDLTSFFKEAAYARGLVDACNVTDGQAALMKLGSLSACHLLKDFGVEPILQITCRDRNRIALQSDLLSASALGIQNVLVLTGDPIQIGDHPEAKAVFDLDAMTLLKAIKTLESGTDLNGHPLNGAPQFCIAAAANPCVQDLDTELSKTLKKVESGAEFFQTQGVFQPNLFIRYIETLRKHHITTPVLAGIILLKSAKMARFMNEKIPGVVIPPPLIERFEKSRDLKTECIRSAVELIKEIKPYCQGIHIMPIGWDELIPTILKEAGLVS